MKKLLCVLFVLILSFPIVAMAEIDWKGMSVEEIQAEINKARAEIFTREIKSDEKGTVILDADGVVVSITKVEIKESYDGTHYLHLSFDVVNNSNESVAFRTDKVYLNGWEISGWISANLDAGMKARKEDSFYDVDIDADVSSYEDLEELKLIMHTYDSNTYMTKTNDIECTVYFK